MVLTLSDDFDFAMCSFYAAVYLFLTPSALFSYDMTDTAALSIGRYEYQSNISMNRAYF